MGVGWGSWVYSKDLVIKSSPHIWYHNELRKNLVLSSSIASFTTSQAYILPLYLFTTVVMWSFKRFSNTSLVTRLPRLSLKSHLGVCWCQHRLWPLTFNPCACAKATIESASLQL